MTRIDKIKLKRDKNNVIDIDIKRLEVKMDNSFSNKDIDWILLSKENSKINIKSIFTEDMINKKNFLMIEFRHYLKVRSLEMSYSSIYAESKAFRHFILKFVKNSKIEINSFSDINYNILIKYSDFIRLENTNTQLYYKRLINILNNASRINDILVSEDIKKRNYPNIKLPKNRVKNNIPYSEKDFILLSNIVKNMINLYFNQENKNISLFVKSAYWYIAMFTGFNQSGMNSLKIDSFSLIKKDERQSFFQITCEKNRSKSGKQTMVIPLTKENNLFLKVFNELQKIRKEIESENFNIFSYKLNNKEFEYLGRSSDFHDFYDVRKYIKENNLKNIRILSTLNIRQFFSTKMFDKTKSELLVSKIMGHQKLSTTEKHYMKNQINEELKFKFNIVQNLMNSFANNNLNNWVDFQNAFGIKELTLEEIYFKIKDGYFDNAIGKCIKDSYNKENKCKSYLNCLSCKNFSLVGEIDFWKIISFKESIIKNCEKSKVQWIIEIIEDTIKEIDNELIILVKNRINKYGLYPFWKNELMVKTIVEGYISE